MGRETLLILPSLKAAVRPDGRVVVTEKFLDEMAEFQQYWDGPTAAILEPAARESSSLDNVAVAAASLPFALNVLPFDDERMLGYLAEAAVVLGRADYRQNHLAQWCLHVGTPLVVNTDYTLETRRGIAAAHVKNRLQRWRRQVWEWSQERAVRRSVAAAAGVQCNGLPTFANYRALNDRCLSYFDTCVTEDLLPDEERLETRLAELLRGGPLRLAFSYLLSAMQGADHLPPLANELRRLGVPFSLEVYGAGGLEPAIRAALAQDELAGLVKLKGSADFKTEIRPRLQEYVDLFVCPHRLGDASSTYVDTLACGVPIVGYANEAWGLLISTADVGLAAPVEDVEGLALAVAALHTDRELTARLSLQAWEFGKAHTRDKTLTARIEHLRKCAGISSELATT